MISIIVPTTGRKALALQSIQKILETTQNFEVEVICVVDVDTETRDALTELGLTVIFSDRYLGSPGAINNGLRNAHGDYFIGIGDDCMCQPGWLDEAMRVFQESFHDGVGMVGLNDGHHDGNQMATMFMVSRPFVIRYMGGVLGFECYRKWFGDLEMTERAKRSGRYSWANKAVVYHISPEYGEVPRDATNERDRRFINSDSAMFQQRKIANFPDDFAPIIKETRMTTINVLVPAHNRVSRLDLTLDSLRRADINGWQMDIVVCDDGSTEDLWPTCQKYKAKCVRHMENMGTAQARRTLISHAWGDYIWLLDSDMFVSPNAVHGFLSVVRKGVACCGRMNKLTGDPEAEGVLGMATYEERLAYLTSKTYPDHRHDWPSDKARPNIPEHWAFTGNQMIWGEDFRRFSYIPYEIVGWGHDDTVLVKNLHDGGVAYLCSDAAQTWHIQRDLIREGNLGQQYTPTALKNAEALRKMTRTAK